MNAQLITDAHRAEWAIEGNGFIVPKAESDEEPGLMGETGSMSEPFGVDEGPAESCDCQTHPICCSGFRVDGTILKIKFRLWAPFRDCVFSFVPHPL